MQTLVDFMGQSQGPVQRWAMPALTRRRVLTGASTRDPLIATNMTGCVMTLRHRLQPLALAANQEMLGLARKRVQAGASASEDGGLASAAVPAADVARPGVAAARRSLSWFEQAKAWARVTPREMHSKSGRRRLVLLT